MAQYDSPDPVITGAVATCQPPQRSKILGNLEFTMKKILILAVLLGSLPAFSTVALVQSIGGTGSTRCDSNGATVASKTCSFTTLPTVGNRVIVALSLDSFSTTTATCADNQSNSYTQRALSPKGSVATQTVQIIDAKVVTSSGTFTVTCTPTASTYILIHLYEFSGLDTTAPFDQSGTSGSTTVANELVFEASGWGSAGAVPVAGTGFTLGEKHTAAATTVIAGVDEYSTAQAGQESLVSGTVAEPVVHVVGGGGFWRARLVPHFSLIRKERSAAPFLDRFATNQYK